MDDTTAFQPPAKADSVGVQYPRKFKVRCEVEVEITVNWPTVIDRCVENHDDEGVPQPDVKGGTGWRNYMYDLSTAEDVVSHLAYNWVVNSAAAHELDGWADLDPKWDDPYAAYEAVRGTWEAEVEEVAADA